MLCERGLSPSEESLLCCSLFSDFSWLCITETMESQILDEMGLLYSQPIYSHYFLKFKFYVPYFVGEFVQMAIILYLGFVWFLKILQ